MRILLIFTLAVLKISFVFSQVEAQKIPLHQYKFSTEIDSGLMTGEMKAHRAAQYFSYIGEYQKALSVPNEVELEWGFDTLTIQDKMHFQKYKVYDAVEAIIKRAEQERIIIINEAHHKPLHRVFTKKAFKGII